MMDDEEEIYVCADCLQASCYAGIFMCWNSQMADVKKITKREARALNVEHESYLQLQEVQAK